MSLCWQSAVAGSNSRRELRLSEQFERIGQRVAFVVQDAGAQQERNLRRRVHQIRSFAVRVPIAQLVAQRFTSDSLDHSAGPHSPPTCDSGGRGAEHLAQDYERLFREPAR